VDSDINKPMSAGRVGMLVHGYYPLDPRVRREAEALASFGYQVEVVCLRRSGQSGPAKEPRRETINGVRVHRLPLERKRGGQLRYFFEYAVLTLLGSVKLARLHLSRRFQVVHIHNMPDLLVLAGMVPKWTGARLLLDVHDPMPELYQANGTSPTGLVTRFLNWQQRLACNLADRVVSVSEPMRENLQQKGVPRDKILIVHNFPDSRYFPFPERFGAWPKNQHDPVMLYCGTVTEHYQLEVAVGALAIALKQIPGLRLRIVGEGNRLAEVREFARRLAVEQKVEFIAPMSNDKMRHLMADADIGVSTRQAGVFGDLCFSTKILEYLSQGLPVVSSRTETMVRYIPEDTVFYFDPGNSEDMAHQIVRMWTEPTLAQQSLTRARDLLSRYAWDIEKARLAGFYRMLLAQPYAPEMRDTGKLQNPTPID
jgi:glycosyltransferase involved in cell wall biosynthesis